MEPTDLKSLTNISANISEIIGISSGLGLLITTWIPAVFGLKGYWWKFLVCAIILIVVGLAAPGIIQLLESVRSPVRDIMAMIAGALILLLQCCLGLLGLFAPIGIAYREKLERKGLIIGLTFGTILMPPCWVAALIMCGLEMKNKPREGESLEPQK